MKREKRFLTSVDYGQNGKTSEQYTINQYKISIKTILLKVIYFSLFCLLVTFFCGLSQFAQYNKSSEDVRIHTVMLWSIQHPNQKEVAQKFITECLISQRKIDYNQDIGLAIKKHKERVKNSEETIYLYECGNDLGLNDLMAVLKASDFSMHSIAFPLSILTGEHIYPNLMK